jgi:hypothetical protein
MAHPAAPRLSRLVAGVGGLLLVGSATLGAADGAADYWVRGMPSLWVASLDGNCTYRQGATPGTRFEAKDLGVANRENVIALEAGAQIPFLFGFHAGYSDYKTDGTTTLTQNLQFGAQLFTAGTAVKTDLDLKDLYGEICVRPLPEIPVVNFGFSLGLAAHLTDNHVGLAGGGLATTLDKKITIPVLAVRAHVNPLSLLGFEARLHLMDVTLSDNHLQYIDAALQTSYRPITWVGIIAGYRYNVFHVRFKDPMGSDSSADASFTKTGPFVGVIAKF